MSESEARAFPLADILKQFGGLALLCISIYASMWVIDFAGVADSNPLKIITQPEARDALSSFGEVAVAILGVAITVAAIIVELAANRYTPRITDLFVRDPVNATIMGFFVVTTVIVVWVDLSLYHSTVYPELMVVVSTGLMSVSLLALLPYFAFVFDFLSPTKIVLRIQLKGAGAVEQLARGSISIEAARYELMTSIEQLGDITLNSIEKKDKAIAIATLAALGEVAKTALRHKNEMPEDWFDSEPLVRNDQDFIALHPDMVRALTQRKTWVEMKVMRQYQAIFGEALHRMRDVNHLIAIQTRRVADVAVELDDKAALDLAIRFMNTYMRATINARDVRSAYNFFNEYRVLAENLMMAGKTERVLELAEYFKFYGQLAFGFNLAFILETAAYDLGSLLELAHSREDPCHDKLLNIFLEVDREPESGAAQESSLRGVRKAQIKMATHYLVRKDIDHARRIFEDMRSEKPGRLLSIRSELEAVTEPEYWEVSDRGINFEFLSPWRRKTLDTFFGWFDSLE